MMDLSFLLTERVTMRVDGVRPEAIFNRLCRSIPIRRFEKLTSESCRFFTNSSGLAAVRAECETLDAEIIVERRVGLFPFLRRLIRRPGLIIGASLSLCFMIYSASVTWEVRVEGNETIPAREIIAALEKVGIAEGKRQDKKTLDRAVMFFRLAEPRVNYLSVNYDGTIAHVVIDESDTVRPVTSGTESIVAKCDGQLVRLDVLGGGAEAKNGDAVTKGQLLISSFKPSRVSGNLFDAAQGFAWARTRHIYRIGIPKTAVVRRDLPSVLTHRSVLILGMDIPLGLHNTRPTFPYRRTQRVGRGRLFDKYPLPFRIRTVEYIPYEVVKETLAPEDGKALADDIYDRLRQKETSCISVIGENDSFAETDTEYLFTYEIECIEDIALAV